MKKLLSLMLTLMLLASFASCNEQPDGTSSAFVSSETKSKVSSAFDVSSGEESNTSSETPPEEETDGFTYTYAAYINGDNAVFPLSAPDQCLYYRDLLKGADTDFTWAYDAIAYEATHFANRNSENNKVCTVYFPQDITAENLRTVYEDFLLDHPELWYLMQPDKNGCVSDETNPRIAYLTFSDPIEDFAAITEQINGVVDEILVGAKNLFLTTDLNREAYLSGYLYDHCEIDWATYNKINHSSPKEVLLDHYGVCVGYALTTVYILRQWGIPAIMGHGHVDSGDGMDHCWAIVPKDGKYVYIDNYDMRKKGVGIEVNMVNFFCFEDIEVYNHEGTTIANGVLLPGSPIGAGQVVTDETYKKDE